MSDPLENANGHGHDCLCDACFPFMHPVDALKRLGLPMTPEQEQRARAICDEPVMSFDLINGSMRTITREQMNREMNASDGEPRIHKVVMTDGLKTRDGLS